MYMGLELKLLFICGFINDFAGSYGLLNN